MTQANKTAPGQLNILYRQHKTTGLLAAFSPELDGLIVFGRTPEQLCEKLPRAASEFVKAITGDDVSYGWSADDEENDDIPPSFVSDELGKLVVMADAI